MGSTIRIKCSSCGRNLKVPVNHGKAKKGRCPACKAVFTIPAQKKRSPNPRTAALPPDEFDVPYDDDGDAYGHDSEGGGFGYDEEYDDESSVDSSAAADEWGSDDDAWMDEALPYGSMALPGMALPAAVSSGSPGAAAPPVGTTPEKKQPTEDLSVLGAGIIAGTLLSVLAGIYVVGTLIYFGSGDPVIAESDPDVEGNVNQGDGDGPGAAVSPDTQMPKTLEAAAKDYVHRAATISEARPTSGWGGPPPEIRREWDLAADPYPEIDFEQLKVLSQSGELLITQPFGPDLNWLWYTPPDSSARVLVNRTTREGQLLEGTRPGLTSAAESGFSAFQDCSPDGSLLAFHVDARMKTGEMDRHWVTLHRFDNSLLQVIPGATAAKFVSQDRLLVARDGDEQYDGNDPRTVHAIATEKHRLPHAVWFVDPSTGEQSPPIDIRHGGHWLLSPNRKYLVIAEPDEATADSLQDLDGDYFNGRPREAEFSVYDTVSGTRVASAAFQSVTSGFRGSFSRDGKKLALRAGHYLTILDMTDGHVVKAGTFTELEDEQNYAQAVDWLGNGEFLLLDNKHIMDPESGILLGSFQGRNPAEPAFLSEVVAGEYARETASVAFAELPLDALKTALDGLEDPQSNLLANRQVALRISGIQQMSPLEQDAIRECLTIALKRRGNLDVVMPEDGQDLVVEVAYSEAYRKSAFSMESWHEEATGEKPTTPESYWKDDQHVFNSTVELNLSTSDGRVLHKQKMEGTDAPRTLDFSLPGSIQFRNAALAKALGELNIELPLSIPRDPNETPLPGRWPIEQLPTERFGVADFDVKSIPINNEWMAGDHGLPIQLNVMAIPGFEEFTRENIVAVSLVSPNDVPSVLIQDASLHVFLIPVATDYTATEIDLPIMSRFAMHPNGDDYIGFHEGKLIVGKLSDPANSQEIVGAAAQTFNIAFAGDGSRIALAVRRPRQVVVYDTATLNGIKSLTEATPVAVFENPKAQNQITFSGDGKLLAAYDTSMMMLWQVDDQQELAEEKAQSPYSTEKQLRGVSISPTGKSFYMVADGNVSERASVRTRLVRQFDEKRACDVQVSPDGQRLAIGRDTLSIAVVNLTGEPTPKVFKLAHALNVQTAGYETHCGWSSDGGLLFGYDKRGLTVWSIPVP